MTGCHGARGAGARARAIAACGLTLAALAAPAAGQVPVPPPIYPVRDDARVLDAATRERLVALCRELSQTTGAELGVLLVDTTRGEDHHAYAVRVFNRWGIGKAHFDNGVLLLFALADRRVELVPGRRFERVFTKAACQALLEEAVVPHMRAGRPGEGVLAGARRIVERVRAFEAGGPAAAEAVQVDPRVELERTEFGGGGSGAPGGGAPPGGAPPGGHGVGTFPLRDDAGALAGPAKDAVELVCRSLEAETGIELGVWLTRGRFRDAEQAAAAGHAAFAAWGVGKAGRDDGLLLVLDLDGGQGAVVPGRALTTRLARAQADELIAGAAARLRRDPALAVQFTVERLDGLARGWGLGGPAVAPALSFGGGRPGWWGPPPGDAIAAPAAAPSPARTREDAHAPPPAPTAREPRAHGGGPSLGGRGAARGVAALVLVGWGLGLGFLLQQALGLGRLFAPKPVLWLLALGGPLAAGGLLFLGVGSRFDAPDVGIAATGAVGGVVGLILTSHICPRCSKWMSITRRTLVSATYSSSGKGERTERCSHCGHAARSTYTIARLQRTTSTSSSYRSSGGSSSRSSGGSSSRGSFGGGSSRGGGGGASW